MARYAETLKNRVVAKLLPPESASVSAIAKEVGVTVQTLERWRDEAQSRPTRGVLAAASGSQLSSTYEAAQQGLFSYWLMKGLEGDADANKDKKITAGELHDYVSKNVGPMAQRRNRQQDPQLMGDSTRVLVSY